MNTNGITIRLEQESDYRKTEELVRDSFWNVYRPGCSEHFVLHVLRGVPAFVRELDLVMESGGRLIGQSVFVRAEILADGGGTVPVLTMGPICVARDLRGLGLGRLLLDESLRRAAELGFGAVLIEGDIGFYGGSGFVFASELGIRYGGLPEGADASFFLCRELIPGFLSGVSGVYSTPEPYLVTEAQVGEFDRGFPPREKLRLPGQLEG